MHVQQGDVPVYTVAGATTARPLPDWLARRRKRSLKADPEYQNRIELLQDFSFEEASSCVRVSEDNNWIVSTGTYKPQIHVHYLPHLSLSYARHTTSLNIKFSLLSADASKSLHLQSDRRVELHTLAGLHEAIKLPRYGRDLCYDHLTTEALVGAVGVGPDGQGEVFRFNLEAGRFMQSYQIDVGTDTGSEVGLQGSSTYLVSFAFPCRLVLRLGSGINVYVWGIPKSFRYSENLTNPSRIVWAPAVNSIAIAENTHNLLAFGTSVGSVEVDLPPYLSSYNIANEGMDSSGILGPVLA
jgi:ribosome biogenesis protein ENP2